MSQVAADVTGDGEITLSGRLGAAPSEAWEVLTDAAELPSWLGFPIIFDLWVGGRIEVEVESGHRFAGEFVAIEPPHRLAFTWGWRSGPMPIAPGSTLVEMTLRSDGDGSRVQLVHSGLGEWAERHMVAWSPKLGRLIELHPPTASDK